MDLARLHLVVTAYVPVLPKQLIHLTLWDSMVAALLDMDLESLSSFHRNWRTEQHFGYLPLIQNKEAYLLQHTCRYVFPNGHMRVRKVNKPSKANMMKYTLF